MLFVMDFTFLMKSDAKNSLHLDFLFIVCFPDLHPMYCLLMCLEPDGQHHRHSFLVDPVDFLSCVNNPGCCVQ